MIPIVDAHLDLAWNALSFDRDLTQPLDALRRREAHMTDHPSRGKCTTSLPEMRRAGIGLCVATLLARSGPEHTLQKGYRRTDLDHGCREAAYAVAQGQLAYYRLLESNGHIRIIRTSAELREHWTQWNSNRADTPLGVILGMEGTDPVFSPEQLNEWWSDGLRLAGLAHYGRSHYAHGTGTDGPLSRAGVQLLRRFEELGIVLDVTHLSDRSFDEALDSFDGPLLASHHNCRSLVPGQRQLKDSQIRSLIRRGAVIGTAMDAWMLYSGWERGTTSPQVLSLEAAADHIDHVCGLAGNHRHSAIGSDLDGGFGYEQTPRDLKTVADLQKLAAILDRRGYRSEEVSAIFHGNWVRFFEQTLPIERDSS